MNERLQRTAGEGASTRLESYLGELRSRIRNLIYARAAAVVAGSVLALTALFVWWLYSSGYQDSVAWTGRVLLITAVVCGVAGLLWWPLRKLAAKEGSQEFERRLPEQRGRIETYLDIRRREATDGASPLTDLLAEDAAGLAAKAPVDDVIPKQHLLIPGAVAALAVMALAFLMTMAPGHWGFGTRHLLFGAELPRNAVPVRRIVVSPGDAVVRRNSDFSIRASADGFNPESATVFVRFDDEQQWQKAPMQSVTDKDDRRVFEFKLYALRGPLHYYVTADTAKSTEHGVTVADLPRIEKVRLTYSYPKWTGLEPLTEDTLRDIRAVAETSVKVEVFSDATLDAPALVVDGNAAPLDRSGEANIGTIAVKKPGKYHIGARVANEFVALTEDYPIEIVTDEKPTIQIVKPGRDWRATSIEEVPVRIQAQDDFRVQNVELRYAVNGGKWQSVPVGAGDKDIKSDSLLRLEELGAAQQEVTQLEPGDIVSYYAVAKDRSKSVQTDLFMVQVQPFERRFMQSGGGGGGGGGGGAGDEQGAISERQKEILLATWNLQRSDQRESRTKQQLEESAKMLAEMQTTLAGQARTVAERTRARISVDSDERIKTFVESMEKAASTMEPAAKRLGEFKLDQAVPIEQQALQQLLRAEAAFRDVQVSMSRESGGGGGGQQAARNFTEMFELEMDVEKNQYESQSQLSMESKKQEVDEALKKLKELAARQEKLAEEAQRKQMTAQEQRWRQEQLRREAEDLKRQLAELSKQQNSQQASNQQQQSGQQQSGQQQSGQQQSGSQQANNQQSGQQQSGQPQNGQQQNGQPQNGQQQNQQQNAEQQNGQPNQREDAQVQNALNSLQKALDDMRAANQQNQSGDATRSAREASENLKRALKQMDQPQGVGIDKDLERFADRTQSLSDTQRGIEGDLNKALSDAQAAGRRRGVIDPRSAAEIAAAKQQMATELEALQREMRESVHKNRTNAPDGSKKLGEIVNNLESSGVAFRINRSAAEVLYGRARDAAPREGLITEGLESLERDLREAAALAANDQKRQGKEASPQELLAQIGELRRALEEARREPRGQGQGQQSARDGEQLANNNEQQNANQRQNAQGEQAGGQSPGQSGSQSGSQSGNQRGQASARNGGAQSTDGGTGPNGLAAWNPDTRSGSWQNLERGTGRLRDTRAMSERVQELANRMDRGQMSDAELRALQRMAHDLRRLSGNPIATSPEAMSKLIDQLELATLAAAQKANQGAPARTAVQSADATEYREAVAEYYRRLGGS